MAGCGKLELLAAANEVALLAFCRTTGFSEEGRRLVRPLRKSL
jgi:hypothetical protein